MRTGCLVLSFARIMSRFHSMVVHCLCTAYSIQKTIEPRSISLNCVHVLDFFALKLGVIVFDY